MPSPGETRTEVRLAPRAEEASRAEPGDAAELAMRTCPTCGAALAERRCKLYCPRPGCGYFLSCADYY